MAAGASDTLPAAQGSAPGGAPGGLAGVFRISLSLLHGFRLEGAPTPIQLPLSAQRVLAFLALHEGPLQRLFVAGNLWIDSSEQRANASLRTALWRLHRPGCTLVHATATHISLSDEIDVDVRDAAARAQRALRHAPEDGDLPTLCDAGDLLPDWYDDWVLIERERFHELRVRALETLSELHLACREVASAIRCSSEAVRADPLRESSRRILISALLVEGNRAEALAHHRQFRQLLQPLGLVPSPRFDEIAHDLVAR